jgi:hypothetical protein
VNSPKNCLKNAQNLSASEVVYDCSSLYEIRHIFILGQFCPTFPITARVNVARFGLTLVLG